MPTTTVTLLSGSPAPGGSLAWAVATAPAGDTIQFATDLKGDTITLGNTPDISKPLTIDEGGAASPSAAGV